MFRIRFPNYSRATAHKEWTTVLWLTRRLAAISHQPPNLLFTDWQLTVLQRVKSYFTTGGLPPISSSWHQAPWDSRPVIFVFYWTLAIIVLMYNILSDERMGLSFTTAAGHRQRCHSQVREGRDSGPNFIVSYSRLPPTWRARSPYLYLPGTGWPSYNPRHWFTLTRFVSIYL
jgi:hypothetical protein